MHIIDYSQKPKQICFEAVTEEETKLLNQVKALLKRFVPKEVIQEHGNDFLVLNL